MLDISDRQPSGLPPAAAGRGAAPDNRREDDIEALANETDATHSNTALTRADIKARFNAMIDGGRVLTFNGLPFDGLPKEYSAKRRPLLWTQQTEALWNSFLDSHIPSQGEVHGLILAGPSGIGKSGIALLIALRAFAEGSLVLYVYSTYQILARWWGKCVNEDGLTYSRNSVLKFTRKSLLKHNADLISSEDLAENMTWPEFQKFLHDRSAVVVFDGHGHAYNDIQAGPQKPAIFCPLIMPNSYLRYRNIGFVFAGSNQATFEIQLNDTYTSLVRYIVPLHTDDAVLFQQRCIDYNKVMTHGLNSSCFLGFL